MNSPRRRMRICFMAQGLTEAVMRRPPRGNGTGEDGQAFTTVYTTATVTNQVVLPTGAPVSGGCWVTFKATSDANIRFGRAGVGAAVSTAASADFLITAGQDEEFWIAYPDDANFSVIGATAGGTLYRFRSSR